ncbi:MAG: rhodanese-like domain-containing protein [Halobacteriovoraceae bacterium]|jgi:rhodanese-related sulfurtransferase|nr:rhodanese-like domain-containing protein [Halobacteriovoraceae bacterium]MBT5093861.1 rhodanese-like domain-containing protein [Halobacteriovoraceae bacterium]
MIKSIDSNELKTKLDKGEDVVLIDCREQGEWDDGHIGAAKLLPLSQLVDRYSELESKDAELIFQCRSGKRSMDACMFLLEKGYTNLTNLEGGILGWAENGFETTQD